MASAVENIIKMIRILQNESCVSGQDLAYRLGVSVKTIQKYKQDLDQMHIYIETKKGRYGGYYIDHSILELHASLSDEELSALIDAKNYLELDKKFPKTQELMGAVDKVLQNERMANSAKNKASINKLSGPGYRGGFERIKLEKLQAAIREEKIVFIEYDDNALENFDSLIHPYSLIQMDGKFALIAFCESRGDVKLFHVELIRHLATTKYQFVPPESVEILWAPSMRLK